jgi:hypothetical protein
MMLKSILLSVKGSSFPGFDNVTSEVIGTASGRDPALRTQKVVCNGDLDRCDRPRKFGLRPRDK